MCLTSACGVPLPLASAFRTNTTSAAPLPLCARPTVAALAPINCKLRTLGNQFGLSSSQEQWVSVRGAKLSSATHAHTRRPASSDTTPSGQSAHALAFDLVSYSNRAQSDTCSL